MNFNLATESEIIQELSIRLKQYRILRNMTQKELAVAADIGFSTVHRFEMGKGISLDSFLKIVMALGLIHELSHLFELKFSSLSDLEKVKEKEKRYRVRK